MEKMKNYNNFANEKGKRSRKFCHFITKPYKNCKGEFSVDYGPAKRMY